MAKWRSNIPKLQAVLERERPRALVAAAQVLINEVKRNLAGGYTSGDFVTGNSLNHVTRTEPERVKDGWSIKVGGDLMHNLYWELGHQNIFTRRYERVEVWAPAYEASMDRMSEVYAEHLRDQIAGIE